MCDIVVRVEAPPNAGPGDTEPGHIVEVAPDDWPFSPVELATPQYRFLRLPGVSVEAVSHWKSALSDVTGTALVARSFRLSAETVERLAALAPGEKHDIDPAALRAGLVDERIAALRAVG